MIIKTATGLAFAAACLTTIATMPADAQTAGPYGGPQTYQGSTSPNWPAGTSGSTSGNYTPQNDQGGMAPSSAGTGWTVAVEPPPRADPGDVNWDPQRNVMEAQRYDRLVERTPLSARHGSARSADRSLIRSFVPTASRASTSTSLLSPLRHLPGRRRQLGITNT
jgi:hypothetical protein